MTKATFQSNILLSSFVAAQAGDASAQSDAIVSAAYTAFFHVLKGNNKTQIQLIETAVKNFADIKNVKKHFAVTTLTAPVKRFHAVYQAYGSALEAVVFPPFIKGRPAAEMEDMAACLATEFASNVQAGLFVEAKITKSDEEKAASKAALDAKKAAAGVEMAETIKAEAEKIAQSSVVTLADMVDIVINAMANGMLSKAQTVALLHAHRDRAPALPVALPIALPVAGFSALV